MNLACGDASLRLANPAQFNRFGIARSRYFMLCTTCDPEMNYYDTDPIPDQGPFIQAYCLCGELRTLRRLVI